MISAKVDLPKPANAEKIAGIVLKMGLFWKNNEGKNIKTYNQNFLTKILSDDKFFT